MIKPSTLTWEIDMAKFFYFFHIVFSENLQNKKEAINLKKMITVVLCMLLILALTACNDKKDNESDSIAKTEQDDTVDKVSALNVRIGDGYISDTDVDTDIGAYYFTGSLFYGDEDRYPALARSLSQLSNEEKSLQKVARKELCDLILDSDAEIDLSNSNDAFVFENTSVKRADSVAFSVLLETGKFIEGIEEDICYKGRTYDTKSGKRLKLKDVVTDLEKLPSLISAQLDRHWGDIAFSEDVDLLTEITADTFEGWTLDYNGLSLYFNSMQLAAYKGMQNITLSFDEYPELVKPEYKNVPESYGFQLAKNVPVYIDVTGDNQPDEVIVSCVGSTYGDDSLVEIYINGNSYTENIFFYSSKEYIVKSKTGEYLLCVETISEGDWKETYYLNLSRFGKLEGSIYSYMRGMYYENPDCPYMSDVLTNPEEFYMCTRTNLGGTVVGFKRYSLSNGKVPATDDNMFVFEEEGRLKYTLLCDISAKVYDEKTKTVTSDIILESGSSLLYFGTDDERYLYFMKEDGSQYYRVEVVLDEYFATLDGKTLDLVFDGLLYAG